MPSQKTGVANPATEMPQLRVLSLQPFYGGSHRAFIDGWVQHSHHQWELETLPDRFWKWRMRQAAVEFAERLDHRPATSSDCIVTTDMLNVAEFRGLMPLEWRAVPLVLYFHENQATYPSPNSGERDLHFAFTNFTSCLAADAVWFNSAFNRDSFLEALERAGSHWPDYVPRQAMANVRRIAEVAYPGVQLVPQENRGREGGTQEGAQPLQIVWAARWEHDKNPEDLYRILLGLVDRGLDFRVSVLGQSFRQVPAVMEQIRTEFGPYIDQWGFLERRSEYMETLANSDVFVSTAHHEFFGLSLVEALSQGVLPVLPRRLAYPEVIQRAGVDAKFYDSIEQAIDVICELATRMHSSGRVDAAEKQKQSARVADTFGWVARAEELDRRLGEVVQKQNRV